MPVVWLCGTPGQRRFWLMWDELAPGALGLLLSDPAGCLRPAR